MDKKMVASRIRKGDNINHIAKDLGVNPKNLRAWVRIEMPEVVGLILDNRKKYQYDVDSVTLQIKKGKTLRNIAKECGIPPQGYASFRRWAADNLEPTVYAMSLTNLPRKGKKKEYPKEVIELVNEIGMAKTCRKLKTNNSTLRRWLDTQGIPPMKRGPRSQPVIEE